MFNNFFSENRAVYEIMSKNVVEPARPQIAYWISKATHAQVHASASAHTHTEISNTYCYSRQQWLHEGFSLLRYTYSAVFYSVCLY